MRRYISIQSLISVRSRKHDFNLTPSTAQDLAAFALMLLVDELGTEGARLFLRKQFAEYRPDYRGIERDNGDARKDAKPPMTGYSPSAHSI